MTSAALEILHLDNHLFVVNKPAGMLVQEDETGDPDVLRIGKRLLKERFGRPGNVYLGLVHRLDRPASGVVVLARTSKAAARLSDQFRRRTPQKDYLAVVEGACTGAGIRRDVVATDAGGRVRVVEDGDKAGKPAELQWRSAASHEGLSLLSIRLKTGRKHQIRIQLSVMGHPILGDFRYGAARELDGHNLALHAYRLSLVHPTKKEWMTFSALPPPSWRGFFDREVEELVRSVS
jgi:RluA family pseudouridine synthase